MEKRKGDDPGRPDGPVNGKKIAPQEKKKRGGGEGRPSALKKKK